MEILANLTHVLLPCLGLFLLIAGIRMEKMNYVMGALWLSLIALLLHYQSAGGEILGTYFDYKNAFIYSFNLIILITTLLYLFLKFSSLQGRLIRYITGFASAFLIVGGGLLMANLWTNACFIENRRIGTPIMQVATFAHLDYCAYQYVFYKVSSDGNIAYMCPNHYGVIPSIGHLKASPDFLLNHVTLQSRIAPKLNVKQK